MDRETLCEKLAACILANFDVLEGSHLIEQRELAKQLKVFSEMFVCLWWNCEEYWQTDCGEMFTVTTGSPSDNNMVHCHCCGNFIKVVANYEEALEIWKIGCKEYERGIKTRKEAKRLLGEMQKSEDE